MPDLLRRDVVDVSIDSARSENQLFAGNGVGGGADPHARADAFHGVGVAGFARAHNFAVFDAHVGFDDAQQGIDDGDVGDDQIEGAVLAAEPIAHAHAVAHGFAAAVDGLVAVVPEVAFDLDVKVGVAQADFVAHGGPEVVDVFLTGDFGAHLDLNPFCSARRRASARAGLYSPPVQLLTRPLKP